MHHCDPRRLLYATGALCIALSALALSGCGTKPSYEPEAFGSTTTHSRSYPNPPSYTCEAARRALLSQGFVIEAADGDHVNGHKNFQPQADTHVEIEFHVVCAPEGKGSKETIAFVNALQDRYAIKKSASSASVGVSVLGSLSLPFSASDDSMVRVASETITSAPFYDRFFVLLKRYLDSDADMRDDGGVMIIPMPAASAASSSPVR
jgi:hypothetical protein